MRTGRSTTAVSDGWCAAVAVEQQNSGGTRDAHVARLIYDFMLQRGEGPRLLEFFRLAALTTKSRFRTYCLQF